jgi:hypothetical protein
MLAVILAELLLGAVLALVFAVLHSLGPWRGTAVGRQLMMMAVVTAGELGTLGALAAGYRPPMWLLVAGFGLVDLVMVRWLWLLWQARHVGAEARDA